MRARSHDPTLPHFISEARSGSPAGSGFDLADLSPAPISAFVVATHKELGKSLKSEILG
jgi:hypothetical protein